jgi:hypothetical protein
MVKQQLGGVALVLFGIGLVAFGVIGPFATYQEVQTHETTEATIVSTGIESATEIDEGETEVEFYPRIEYDYTVSGSSYTDNQVYHPSQVENEAGELRGKEFDQRGQAEDVVNRFSEGKTVTAYYDPDDPTVSYLVDPSTDLLIATGFMGLFGVGLSGMGVGAVFGLVSLNDEEE